MHKKVLILGGSYFIGLSVIKQLLKNKNYLITTLNRGSKPNKYTDLIEEIFCDRNDREDFIKSLNGKTFDFVIDISGFNRNDVETSYEALKNGKIKQYIFISSGSVYKVSKIQPIKEEFERGKNLFWGQYGTDKVEAEDFLFEKFKSNNFPITILRPPYIYGEGNYVYRESYIFDRLKENKPILIPNKGNTRIQYNHVDDLANTIIKLIETSQGIGEAFNTGDIDDKGVTFREWVEICMKAYGKTTEIIECDTKKLGFNSRDFFPYYDFGNVFDTQKIRKIYTPKIELEEGLRRAKEWYEENENKVSKKYHFTENENKILELLGLQNMRINLYFDFDNTLGHRKNGMWSKSLITILKREGVNHINLEDISALMHQNRFSWNYPETPHKILFKNMTWWDYHNKSMKNILMELGIDEERADQYSKKMKDEYLKISEWELYDNTIEILNKSKELGYNNYIISNHVPELRKLLTDLDVLKYFDGLYNSGELGYEKPNKMIYQYALDKSEKSDFNIMIGDNYNADILGSLELGFKAIFVRKPNLYDYKYYSKDMNDLFDIIGELNKLCK